MTKRFTDNELWDKQWFQELSLKHKCLFNYLCSKCDCAGVWSVNYRQASFVIGEKITQTDILEINSIKKQFEILSNGNIFIIDFIKFQYNCEINELNPKFSVHKGILKKLNKNSILETLTQPLADPPLEGLQDKDMVKDKDKVKDKDIFINGDFQKVFEIYSQHCPNLIPLGYEKRNLFIREKINQVLEELEFDFEKFTKICDEATHLKEIANNKIDLKSLLNNYIGILNGKYKKSNQKGLSSGFIDNLFSESGGEASEMLKADLREGFSPKELQNHTFATPRIIQEQVQHDIGVTTISESEVNSE